MQSDKKTALITGASSGIGKALAKRFASEGFNVILVARDSTHLNQVASEIGTDTSGTIQVLPKDLTQESAADEIFNELEAQGVVLDVLVNDAGVGQRGKFHEVPIEKDLTIIHLNIEALVRLTKKFLPGMVERGQGRIVNLGSIAGFQPGPLLAVYHASKAFVVSFSEALATELEDTGVTVTCVCPGPTDTDFDAKADMEGTRIFQSDAPMEPQQVADSAFDAAMRAERIIIPGAANKVLTFGRRFLPEKAQAKANRMLYKEKQ